MSYCVIISVVVLISERDCLSMSSGGIKRIIVFSDTHGRGSAVRKILQKPADAYIFLGDGERELDEARQLFPDKKIYSVCGNCDIFSSAQNIDIYSENGVRIMFTHGHHHKVKYTLDVLLSLAKSNDIKVMLFGHTHCRRAEYIDGIYLLNPGSAAEPRDFLPPSYAYIDITKKGDIFCAHANV